MVDAKAYSYCTGPGPVMVQRTGLANRKHWAMPWFQSVSWISANISAWYVGIHWSHSRSGSRAGWLYHYSFSASRTFQGDNSWNFEFAVTILLEGYICTIVMILNDSYPKTPKRFQAKRNAVRIDLVQLFKYTCVLTTNYCKIMLIVLRSGMEIDMK